jgi:FKBP-type peptidyl-prolyl cis-trans isomerase
MNFLIINKKNRMKNSLVAVLTLLLFSVIGCNSNEKINERQKKKKKIESYLLHTNVQNKTLVPSSIVDEKKFKNGLAIKWFEHGKGQKINKEEVIFINYQVFLADGTLVDGNELLKKPALPFLVGFGMQTKGWDLALENLVVGDFVEVFIPSKLARGDKGIKGLIPPNSVNILRIKVLKKLLPTRVVDGTKVWLLEENKEEQKKAKESNTIEFHYMVGTPTNPLYDYSYKRNVPFRLRFTDHGVVKGLKDALINAKKSDKIWIVVPPSNAYGNKGLLDLVKPNEKVFYDIFVMEVS